MTMEKWKYIAGYEGYYQVSDCGNVRSVDRTVTTVDGVVRSYTGHNLSLADDGDGYMVVLLSKDNIKKHRRVHRLVLDAFVGIRPDGLECCHNDGCPSNNMLNNLRWDTISENKRDMIKHGSRSTQKLSARDALGVKQLLKRTTMTLERIGELYGVRDWVIAGISAGRTWQWLSDDYACLD